MSDGSLDGDITAVYVSGILSRSCSFINSAVGTLKAITIMEKNSQLESNSANQHDVKEIEKCVFCKIIRRELPATVLNENDKFITFVDIKPAATTHFLVIPKKHIKTVKDITKADVSLIDELKEIGEKVLGESADKNKARFGFHVPPFNSVNHLHLHVIYPEESMRFFSRIAYKRNSIWFKSPEAIKEAIEKASAKL